MSNISTLLKENYDLKNELESMVMRIKENEAKHHGFKVIEFSLLLSDNLDEIDNKPLKYIEEIFDIERAVLFIRKDALAVAKNFHGKCSRIVVLESDAFSYTFLEAEVRSGTDKSVIHKGFQLMPSDVHYSYALVPITDNGRIIATLGFYSSDKSRFTNEQNFDFVEEFALIASIALKKLDNAYMLEMQANTDYLTGLPNKFIFDMTAKSSFEEYLKNGREFSFILFNINNYKIINEKYGFYAGDEILKLITNAMKKEIKGYDIFGRFGGDEFYLFSEITDSKKLSSLINNIINAVESIEYSDNSMKFGFAGGAVIVKRGEFLSFEDVMKKAYINLFNAKKSITLKDNMLLDSIVMGI